MATVVFAKTNLLVSQMIKDNDVDIRVQFVPSEKVIDIVFQSFNCGGKSLPLMLIYVPPYGFKF